MARPGVMYAEREFVGRASLLALPPEAPGRADKGDLGLAKIANMDPKPLSGRVPFVNLRGR